MSSVSLRTPPTPAWSPRSYTLSEKRHLLGTNVPLTGNGAFASSVLTLECCPVVYKRILVPKETDNPTHITLMIQSIKPVERLPVHS